MLATIADAFLSLFSSPKQLTPKEAEHLQEQEDRAAEFRRYVREFETRRDQIIDQSRAGQRRDAEEQRERDEGRRRREDHGRER